MVRKTYKKNKIIFKTPKVYRSKVLDIIKLDLKGDPIIYVEEICNLKSKNKNIFIIHKPLKFAAEFGLPDKIFVDFRNHIKYILLCIAHEYVHILLKCNIHIPYSIEQSLAILLQLSYEDRVGIRKFNQNTAKELMSLMNVWPEGKIFLKNWKSFLRQNSKKRKYKNILEWLNDKKFESSFNKEKRGGDKSGTEFSNNKASR